MLKWFSVALALVILDTAAHAGAVGPRFQANTYKTDNQHHPAVARMTNGGFVAVWSSYGQDGSGNGIYAQIYSGAGARIGTELQVNTRKFSDQNIPAVAGLTGGGFVVTWHSPTTGNNKPNIYGQRFSSTGQRQGVEFRINTTMADAQQNSSVAALANGGFIVVWSSFDFPDTNIVGQRYKATGIRDGSEFKIGTTTSGGDNPKVDGLSDSGFVVTWASTELHQEGIYARRYSASGAAAAVRRRVAFLADSFTHLENPKIAGLKNGSFIITWDDPRAKSRTYGQLYTASGLPSGARFQVNTTPWSTGSTVAPLANGGFVITYLARTTSARQGIFGQRYDAGGTSTDVEFTTPEPEDDHFPTGLTVAGLSHGFVVIWSADEGNVANREGIFGQRFNP
jgi:hypothetical protein